MSENNGTIKEILRSLGRIEGTISGLAKRMEALEEKMGDYNERLTRIEGKLDNGIRARIDNLDRDIEETKEWIDDVDKTVDTLLPLKGKIAILIVLMSALVTTLFNLVVHFIAK